MTTRVLVLPEGIGRLVYLPRRIPLTRGGYLVHDGLKRLDLSGNEALAVLPKGLCSLAGLEELRLEWCGLTALPEAVSGLVGLKKLNLSFNRRLATLAKGDTAISSENDSKTSA